VTALITALSIKTTLLKRPKNWQTWPSLHVLILYHALLDTFIVASAWQLVRCGIYEQIKHHV
jgi:hypothetical protein